MSMATKRSTCVHLVIFEIKGISPHDRNSAICRFPSNLRVNNHRVFV